MPLIRGVVTACLLSSLVGSLVIASDEKSAEELILGKWRMELKEKFGKDKNIDFFIEYEFLTEGKAKMTFVLGEPVIKESTSEGNYKLIDDTTLEIDIAPPGSKESKTEQFNIELLTTHRLSIRAKGKEGALPFHRVK